MSTFAFLLLVGVISGGYRTVFGSNCCGKLLTLRSANLYLYGLLDSL